MKKKVIIISVVCALIALIALVAIIFSAVFRVKYTKVEWVGDKITVSTETGETSAITDSQIFQASGIKKGCSTLYINKDKAKSNLESAYPYIRVLQIRIVGARTLEFRLTARHEMFYYTTSKDGYFYILDEELKVLDKVVKTNVERVENLVEIQPDFSYYDKESNEQVNNNVFGVDSHTKAGNFLGDVKYRTLFNSLYISMYKTVLVNDGGTLWLENGQEENIKELLETNAIKYMDRADFSKVLTTAKISEGHTLTGSFIRLELTTKAGVKVVIDAAESDLENKINKCFSMVSLLDSMGENYSSKSGIVSFRLDGNGQGKTYYEKQN